MKIRLNPRLKKITDLIPRGSSVADIGTDHGLIPIYLIQNRISSKVIGIDINKKPLDIAKNNLDIYKLTDKIELRLGSGLQSLKPGEADTIIISGMGGGLISKILDHDKDIVNSIDNFILQPMRGQGELRRYLLSNNFKIYKDILIKEDNRFYQIIHAKKGKQEIKDEIYYEIGLDIKSNPKELVIEFIKEKIDLQKEIIKNIEIQKPIKIDENYKKSKDKLKKLWEVLECL